MPWCGVGWGCQCGFHYSFYYGITTTRILLEGLSSLTHTVILRGGSLSLGLEQTPEGVRPLLCSPNMAEINQYRVGEREFVLPNGVDVGHSESRILHLYSPMKVCSVRARISTLRWCRWPRENNGSFPSQMGSCYPRFPGRRTATGVKCLVPIGQDELGASILSRKAGGGMRLSSL
jgi:hypothetical protein